MVIECRKSQISTSLPCRLTNYGNSTRRLARFCLPALPPKSESSRKGSRSFGVTSMRRKAKRPKIRPVNAENILVSSPSTAIRMSLRRHGRAAESSRDGLRRPLRRDTRSRISQSTLPRLRGAQIGGVEQAGRRLFDLAFGEVIGLEPSGSNKLVSRARTQISAKRMGRAFVTRSSRHPSIARVEMRPNRTSPFSPASVRIARERSPDAAIQPRRSER
jgi:hypothetical protein